MTDDTDADLEALKRQTSHGDRIDEASRQEDTRALREDVLDYLEQIDRGERQKTVSVWDGHLAALVAALDDEGNEAHLEAIGHALQDELDVEREEVDRSDVLRLALRLGLREAAPEYLDALREAVKENAARGL